jgi:hypothetical protein
MQDVCSSPTPKNLLTVLWLGTLDLGICGTCRSNIIKLFTWRSIGKPRKPLSEQPAIQPRFERALTLACLILNYLLIVCYCNQKDRDLPALFSRNANIVVTATVQRWSWLPVFLLSLKGQWVPDEWTTLPEGCRQIPWQTVLFR